jgi:hypothetical protein
MKKLLSIALAAALCLTCTLPAAALGLGILDDNAVEFRYRVNMPDYAADFYDALDEGSDNDGVDDWLIDRAGAAEAVFEVPDTVDELEAVTAFREAVAAFCYDHPERFWLYAYSVAGYYDNGAMTIPIVDLVIPEYQDSSAAELRADIAEMENAVESIKSGSVALPGGGELEWSDDMSKLDKIRFFNAWLTTNCDYYDYDVSPDEAPMLSHVALSALLGGKGKSGPVCEGYAQAFKILCDSEDIDCVFVSGVAGEGFHAWNLVSVWGRWYAVDVTYNDPIGAAEREDYLLVGSNTDDNGYQFWLTHFAGNLLMQTVGEDQLVMLGTGPMQETEAYSDPGEISAWALPELTAAENAGYIPGFSSDFEFTGAVTRSQFAEIVVKMVERLTGEPLTPAAGDTFSDTSNISVLKAYNANLVSGVGGGLYDPDAPATREQIATLMHRAVVYLEGATGENVLGGSSIERFADAAQVSDWAREAVGALAEAGIMAGTSATTLSPKDSCSVEQAVILVYRAAGEF